MADKRGLPPRIFFFTVDQISTLIELDEAYIMRNLLHYEGRSAGVAPRDKMKAMNMAPEGETPEWRVSEQAFIRWLKMKGIRFYERGYVG